MAGLSHFKTPFFCLIFIVCFVSQAFGSPQPVVTASDGAHADKVVVSWSGVSGAAYYTLERTGPDGTRMISGKIEGTTYTDKRVTWETVYTYRVKAFRKFLWWTFDCGYGQEDTGYAGDWDYTDLSVIREDFFPTRQALWESLETMVGRGPRLTGNSAHKQMINDLERDMIAMGFETYRDRIDFKHWEATQYRITILYPDGTREDVPVASYWPRSGETPPEGITAPLAASHFRGNIGIIDFQLNDLLAVSVSELYLQTYKLSGAKALILIRNEPYATIQGDYYPFNSGFCGLPTLFVDREAGAVLKGAEQEGARVTLTLTATVDDDTTDHLYGFLKGKTEDTVILGIHSDGQNALEENGIPAIMGIAHYFSKIPQQFRNKTIGIVFASGHMTPVFEWSANDLEINGWLNLHPDILDKTVAAIAPEHFAALRADISAIGDYVATDEPFTYYVTPSTERLWDICEPLVQNQPAMDCGIMDAWPLKYLMVGSALGWLQKGIPVVGGMSLDGFAGPHYLVNMETGGLDKIDKDLYHDQVLVYARILGSIDSRYRIR